MARVILRQLKCVGAGQCVASAPQVFEQRDEDGTTILLRTEVGADLESAVQEAVDLCPGAAIALIRES